MTEAIAAKVKCQLELSRLRSELTYCIFSRETQRRATRRVSLLHIHFTFLHYGQGRKYGYSERGEPD